MPDNLQDSKSRSTFASLLKGSPPPKEFGKVVEWSITAVLKTAVLRGTGGSNPSLSATERDEQICSSRFFCMFYKSANYAPFPLALFTPPPKGPPPLRQERSLNSPAIMQAEVFKAVPLS